MKPPRMGGLLESWQGRSSSVGTHLPTCHGEVGKYAVLLILVAGVCLQALPFAVVPELQCVVQSCSQDVLAIWRELHEGHRRIVVINERLQTLARGSVPDSAEAIIATGNDQGSITIEMNG